MTGRLQWVELPTADVPVGAFQRRPLEIRDATRRLQREVDDLDRLRGNCPLGDLNRADRLFVGCLVVAELVQGAEQRPPALRSL